MDIDDDELFLKVKEFYTSKLETRTEHIRHVRLS